MQDPYVLKTQELLFTIRAAGGVYQIVWPKRGMLWKNLATICEQASSGPELRREASRFVSLDEGAGTERACKLDNRSWPIPGPW